MSDDEPSGEPTDILLVEDNPGDIRLTQEAFKEVEIANTLRAVTDGAEALDYLYQRGDYEDAPRPDLILLDLNLPRKNGDEILEEIGDDPSLCRIPVIVLTSSETAEDVVKSYDLRANAYLTKPVDPVEFVETVRRLESFWLELAHLPPDEG